MKPLLIFFLVLSSVSYAHETVKFVHLDYDGNKCETYKNDVSEKLKNAIQANNVSGQYTTVTEVEWCSSASQHVPTHRCGCTLMVTLQDSNYELFGKTERAKKSMKKHKRVARLAALTKKIESRDGFLWKDVTRNSLFFVWKGHSIDSLYLVPKQ